METRAHHVLIGLFIVILTAAALLLALALNKPGTNESPTYYKVLFNEAVRGLSKGSVVQYSGIKVGDVAELTLDPTDPRKVWARIRIEGHIPVKEDTQAVLAVTGITGVSVIQLSGGTPESPLLTGKPGADPIIVARRSSLARLFDDGGDMMSNLNELVLNTRQILSPENSQRISQTLINLEAVSGLLAGQDAAIPLLITEFTRASQSAQAVLRKTTTLIESANSLLATDGAKTLNSARNTMASLERSSAQLERLLKNNQNALHNGLQGLNDLGPALQELRRTLAAMRSITRQLQDGPGEYLLGPGKMKEFQP
ncbi:MCE family protein [Alcaligenaceae bacterium]|nr:MCE family protein [Alcaligenaceae bacterium]